MARSGNKDRILVVDEDARVRDLLANQTLGPAGFEVLAVEDGSSGLLRVLEFNPDAILVSLDLIGFSGKDMVAALQSQGFDGPIIVMSPPDNETEILQVFRLGATDYLTKPLRETEAVIAVDRALKAVRAKRERVQLQSRLRQANQQLEQRVKELTTLFGIGKAVASLENAESVFDQLVEAAMFITSADRGWLLLADEETNQLVFQAGQNLPPTIMKMLHRPWNAGLAPLVMISGEPLLISGAGLAKLPIARFAAAALVMPIVVREQVEGVLVLANEFTRDFSERDQAMVAAIADYAAIAIVNVRLFKSLELQAALAEKREDQLISGDLSDLEQLHEINRQLRSPLSQALWQIDALKRGDIGKISGEQYNALTRAEEQLAQMAEVVEGLVAVDSMDTRPLQPRPFILSEEAYDR